ncbi:MAG TPA: hypothetical protein VKU00_28505, partial [Chthonomonadaceae bacterium]|nr:hypothetical protein [Chthonomonadaceae bacterium]
MSRYLCLGLALCALPFLLIGCMPVEFSPDGSQIVFYWNVEGQTNGLFTMNTDGTGFQALPGGDGAVLARWSSDGRYILFADLSNTLNLYDTQTRQAPKVSTHTSLTFAWRKDSQRFAAIGNAEAGGLEVLWYSVPQGQVIARKAFPASLGLNGFAQMLYLPNREAVAVIGSESAGQSHVYVVGTQAIEKLPSSADALGMGLSADRRQLLWASKSPDLRRNLLSLHSYDLTTHEITRLPFPAQVASLNPDPRHQPEEIESVTFSPEG